MLIMYGCTPSQVGLAVDDIKGIQENAELKRLALRVSHLSIKLYMLLKNVHVRLLFADT